MDWQRLRQRILFPWGCFFWSASLVAVACRWRLLDRDPQLDTAPLNLVYVSSVDLAVHGIVGFGLAWLGDRWIRGVANSVLFGLTFVGILFLTRMGYPLTPDLLRQVGGLMEMQTSIAGAADYRTWLLAAAVLGSFWACLALASRFLRPAEGWLWGSAVAATVVGVGLTLALPGELRVAASHLVHTAIRGTVDPDDLLTNNAFTGVTAQPIGRVTVPSATDQRNVIVVVLETFDAGIVDDNQRFAETMPTLYGLHHSALEYTRHYTPWPFSSKALWSITCGRVPLLSSAIGMRLAPTHECGSWTRQLADAGYATWVGYSGDLRYDRMGEFFNAQGFATAWDRRHASTTRYEGFSWGIDDRALFTAFDAWLDERDTNPFAALLLPINSHHPFWTPGGEFERFDDPYRNAFLYQDHLLDRLVTSLKDRKLLDHTVLVVTGDHGLRETRGASRIMEEARFRTPLFVIVPGLARATYEFPTSHADLSGAILRWSGVGGQSLDRYDLASSKPVFVFDTTARPRYMLVEEGGAFVFAPDLPEIYAGARWVDTLDQPCDRRSARCRRIAQSFADNISLSLDLFGELGLK